MRVLRDDDTGRIEIDATRLQGIVVLDHHESKGTVEIAKARAFLAKHGHRTAIDDGRLLRYREGVLEAGETVTILGKARRDARGGDRLVIGDGETGVRASDDPELVR